LRHRSRADRARSRLPLSERDRSDAQRRTCSVRPRAREAIVNRIMPRLLPIVVCSLSIGAAYSADAPSRDPRNAAAPARGALDLRLPDVRSIHAQLETEAAPPADAGEPQVVAVVVT